MKGLFCSLPMRIKTLATDSSLRRASVQNDRATASPRFTTLRAVTIRKLALSYSTHWPILRYFS